MTRPGDAHYARGFPVNHKKAYGDRFIHKKGGAEVESLAECEKSSDCPMGMACWGQRCMDI